MHWCRSGVNFVSSVRRSLDAHRQTIANLGRCLPEHVRNSASLADAARQRRVWADFGQDRLMKVATASCSTDVGRIHRKNTLTALGPKLQSSPAECRRINRRRPDASASTTARRAAATALARTRHTPAESANSQRRRAAANAASKRLGTKASMTRGPRTHEGRHGAPTPRPTRNNWPHWTHTAAVCPGGRSMAWARDANRRRRGRLAGGTGPPRLQAAPSGCERGRSVGLTHDHRDQAARTRRGTCAILRGL